MPLPPIPQASLADWTKHNLSALYNARSVNQFDDAFDGMMARNMSPITVNGNSMTREQFKHYVRESIAIEKGAQVQFPGIVEVPQLVQDRYDESTGKVGVGCFMKAHIDEPIRVSGTPITREVDATFNLIIAPDSTVSRDNDQFYDPRRVAALSSVYNTKGGSMLPPPPAL